MGRIYAGILGPLALATALARGIVNHHDPDAILWNAWWALVAFAALGWVLGTIAGRVVEEDVRQRIAAADAEEAALPE
jgi:hypothetical protein